MKLFFLFFIPFICEQAFALYNLASVYAKPSHKWTVQDGAKTGGGATNGNAVSLDSAGNIYIVGTTNSALDGQSRLGVTDYFLTKYNSIGTKQWTIEGGVANGTVTGYGVTVDADDFIYIVGSTDVAIDGQTQHGFTDFFISKFNTSGILQWTIQNGTTGASVSPTSIGVDSSRRISIGGTIYGAGLDGQTMVGVYDYFLTQYSNSGVRQWTVENGSPGSYIQGATISVDSTGNIYVTGSTWGAVDGKTLIGFIDMYISKYNSSGVRQWTVEDGYSFNWTTGTGISVDSSGNVYATGYALGNGTFDGKAVTAQDFFITKYNSTGTRQWTVVDGPAGGFSYAYGYGIKTDSSGNVYVVGNTLNGSIDGQTLHGQSDLFLTKYNSAGTRQWTVEKGPAGAGAQAYAKAVILDASANIYFVGSTSGLPIDGQTMNGSTDLVVSKYDTSGGFLWTVQNGSSFAPGTANVAAMKNDTAGNLLIVGQVDFALDGQIQKGFTDYFLTKYNSSGVRQWTIQNGTAGGTTVATGMTIDSSNNIYVVGTINSSSIDGQTQKGLQDYFVTKYNSSGVRQWTFENGVASNIVYAAGIALDSTGNIYIAGSTYAAIDGQTKKGTQDLFITKINSSGARLWTVEDGGVAGSNTASNSILIDASDNIYVAGSANLALDGQTKHGSQDYFITKYNTSGTRLWTVQNGAAAANVTSAKLAVDGSGSIYIAANTTMGMDGLTLKGTQDIFISKYDSTGARLWTKETGATTATVSVTDIKSDSVGNIYISGATDHGFDGQSFRGIIDFFVSKYNTSGTRQWTTEESRSSITGIYGAVMISLGLSNSVFVSCAVGTSKDASPLRGKFDLYLTKY